MVGLHPILCLVCQAEVPQAETSNPAPYLVGGEASLEEEDEEYRRIWNLPGPPLAARGGREAPGQEMGLEPWSDGSTELAPVADEAQAAMGARSGAASSEGLASASPELATESLDPSGCASAPSSEAGDATCTPAPATDAADAAADAADAADAAPAGSVSLAGAAEHGRRLGPRAAVAQP